MNRRKLLSFLLTAPVLGTALVKLGFKEKTFFDYNLSNVFEAAYGKKDTWLPKPNYYAQAGEIVTCEHGHPICTFVENVHIGQTQNLNEQLGNWQQSRPKIGEMTFPRCAVCGERFALPNGYFHIGNYWRDPLGNLDLKRMYEVTEIA